MIYSAVITFIALVVIYFYFIFFESKKYQRVDYLNMLQQAKECLNTISSFDDYITWKLRDQIKSQYSVAIGFFKNKTNYYRKEVVIKAFNDIFKDFDSYIIQYNKKYVDSRKEMLSSYFDNVEGKKLDEQQRTALITDEYSNLIIAGAGSGKTLTIIGKVKYLIEKKNVQPENILLLSFTKKTVEELSERLKAIGLTIEAITFHKLGYDTIKKHQSAVPVLTNENTLTRTIKEYLQKDIFNDSKAMDSFIQYVACYMNIPEDNDSFNSLGEKIDTEKGIDFQTLKSKYESFNKASRSVLDSIQGEKVKSVEELMIANFLYLNGIEYEYEKPYPYGDVVYRPDFFLKDYGIYLEHFGVDENNRAKWLTPFNEQKYVEEMQIKKRTHKTNNTKLIETYSYYNRDNVLLQKLGELLKNEGVLFKPRATKDIYEKITEYDNAFGKEIIRLVESFINLSKSRRLDVVSLERLFSDRTKLENDFMFERRRLFLNFARQILIKYDHTLKENNEIDFNDMINLAVRLIKENKPEYSYKYIIVDEYQDISYARFNLIKEIRDLSDARLVCVGDDWQSIYRFAGSDISLFSCFGKYVGPYEHLLIEHTYRNCQTLIDVSSKFILKNPDQIKKTPKSNKQAVDEAVKFVNYKQEEIEDCFINEVRNLVNEYGNSSILVLGRHGFDIKELIQTNSNGSIQYIESKDKLIVRGFENIEIKFLTVHKSKGTEADNVIVLNLRNHLLGFPNKMMDDPILSLLLSEKEDYRFAEERRLFYVALTRTKNKVVLLMPTDVSLFADELITDNSIFFEETEEKGKSRNCPYCKTGKLVVRENISESKRFLGCSHYPICNQTFNNLEILEKNIICPDCDSGYLIRKSGKFGSFLGCTNYPKCRNTI